MSYLPIGNEFRMMWLIVEWKSAKNTHSGYGLVSSEDLVDNLRFEDLHTGKVVNVKQSGVVRQACIVIVSVDKEFLEMEIKHLQDAVQQIGLTRRRSSQPKEITKSAGSPSLRIDSDEGDFLNSGSDWNPSSSEHDSDTDIATLHKKKSNFKKNHVTSKTKIVQDKKVPSKKTWKKCDKTPSKIVTKVQDIRTSFANSIQIQRRSIGFTDLNNVNPHGHMIESSNYGVIERIEEVTHKKSNGNPRIDTPRPRGNLSLSRNDQMNIPPMTFDQQTQTNVSNNDCESISILFQNQNQLNSEIGYLHKVIEDLGIKMETMQRSLEEMQNVLYQKQTSEEEHDAFQNNIDCGQDIPQGNVPVLRDANRCEIENIASKRPRTPYSNYPSPPIVYQNRQPSPVVEGETTASDMIPIGSGKTLIPRHIYNQIKWNSYSYATRKLLMSVFPRRTLATHSLTGKSSPAFSNKPAKMKLDAKKIADIIMTVSQMCKVQESLVRNIITTKCSDENKMYRMRLEKMKNKKQKELDVNQENQFP